MSEQIEVNTVGMDRYKTLSELVKNTHKEKPQPEHLAELPRFFDEDPELWRATGNWPRAHWTIYYALIIHNLLLCGSALAVAYRRCASSWGTQKVLRLRES